MSPSYNFNPLYTHFIGLLFPHWFSYLSAQDTNPDLVAINYSFSVYVSDYGQLRTS